MTRPLPSADDLTYAQYQGWACVWCCASLWTARGGVPVGRARSEDGSSIEVYACPGCAAPDLPPAPAAVRAAGGRVPQTPTLGPGLSVTGPLAGARAEPSSTPKESEP